MCKKFNAPVKKWIEKGKEVASFFVLKFPHFEGYREEDHLLVCRAMKIFQVGERIHLIDKKERHYALTLKNGEIFQHSGDRIAHDSIIGKPDGTTIEFSSSKVMIAIHPRWLNIL